MEKLFNLQKHGTTVPREFLAGLTTFLTMAYILTVNPRILGGIGNGLTPGAVFTATAIASAIATLCMAFIANLPIALAPAIGLNAFFAYIVVHKMGYPWQLALTAVFIEGIFFIIISIFNVREAIANAIPVNLKRAITVGIGFYLAFTGFEKTGMLIRGDGAILGLGKVADPGVFLAIIGLTIIIILHSLKVPGAIFIGIIVTTILGIPMGITKLPQDWKPFSMPEMFPRFKFDFTLSNILTFKFFTVLCTFLFVDIFDTIGILFGVTIQAGIIEKDGTIPRLKQAFLANAVGTVAGAALGTSTVTSHAESAAGVAAGGRTGLTALSTGIFFILALFFWPVFKLVPIPAVFPALIFVGFLMMAPVVEINFKDPTEGIPAFMAIVMMLFAYSLDGAIVYSIADGLIYGILSFVILKVVTRRLKEIYSVTWFFFIVFILKFVLEGGLKILLK
jgi:AGZA family xanthine/uracil permease-like MFS transporter